MKRICVVTGSRAEYGLLRWVLEGIKSDPDFMLQIVVTGMHLSPEFGLTFRSIVEDGFQISRKIEMMLSSDTAIGVTKSMGLGLIGFAEAFDELAPDLLIVLGDRYEIFSAVAAATVAGIPVAHLHGGESTEGALDESLRHSITKMSHLHFTAAESYRQRVIQLGEDPKRVFMVGGLGIDNIQRLHFLSRLELESLLNFKFGNKNLLVTFHPPTLESISAEVQMEELLSALELQADKNIIFTYSNADAKGRILIDMVKKFVATHPNCRAYDSLGQLAYLSCLSQVDGVIGNSSSGLLEAPSLQIGAINIGDRQRGRLKAASVIDCEPKKADILRSIHQLYTPEFRKSLSGVINPYGDGGASKKIVDIIKSFPLEGIQKKVFYDLPNHISLNK
jgi:GDP/UDP-N,N'-diacetylbacillosamine 2-epimerase (hydrolysing)